MSLTPGESEAACALIARVAPHAVLFDRRDGTVAPLDRREALEYATSILGPLTGTWSELRRPARWVATRYETWALLVDGDGYRLSLVGVGRPGAGGAN